MDMLYSARSERIRDGRVVQYWSSLTSGRLLAWGLVGSLIGFGLITFLFALPCKQRVEQLQQEKTYWLTMLDGSSLGPAPDLPTIEQIPYLIETCREFFLAEGVRVTAFNVERLAEKEASGSPLDFALVRIQLAGNWADIENGLEQLEASELAVSVEELSLDVGKQTAGEVIAAGEVEVAREVEAAEGEVEAAREVEAAEGEVETARDTEVKEVAGEAEVKGEALLKIYFQF